MRPIPPLALRRSKVKEYGWEGLKKRHLSLQQGFLFLKWVHLGLLTSSTAVADQVASLLEQISIVWYSHAGAVSRKSEGPESCCFPSRLRCRLVSDVMIKVSANKTNWTGWFARTRAFQCTLGFDLNIWFRAEKLSGLSWNRPWSI